MTIDYEKLAEVIDEAISLKISPSDSVVRSSPEGSVYCTCCGQTFDDDNDEHAKLCLLGLILDLDTDSIAQRVIVASGLVELAEVGERWRKNSSLEEWFPFTAKELAAANAKLKRIEDLSSKPTRHLCRKIRAEIRGTENHKDSE